MTYGKLHNYEIVKNTMEFYKDRFMRKVEIAEHCGLDVTQVSLVIKAAWKLGWCSRIESPIHNNAFGQGNLTSLRTSYKIKRLESWSGLMPLYKEVLAKEKEEKNNE